MSRLVTVLWGLLTFIAIVYDTTFIYVIIKDAIDYINSCNNTVLFIAFGYMTAIVNTMIAINRTVYYKRLNDEYLDFDRNYENNNKFAVACVICGVCNFMMFIWGMLQYKTQICDGVYVEYIQKLREMTFWYFACFLMFGGASLLVFWCYLIAATLR
jgi:hypothetical protein